MRFLPHPTVTNSWLPCKSTIQIQHFAGLQDTSLGPVGQNFFLVHLTIRASLAPRYDTIFTQGPEDPSVLPVLTLFLPKGPKGPFVSGRLFVQYMKSEVNILLNAVGKKYFINLILCSQLLHWQLIGHHGTKVVSEILNSSPLIHIR